MCRRVITKFNPAYDLVNLPNLSVLSLDPRAEPRGITNKLIIDATTPIAPEHRGPLRAAPTLGP